MIDTDTTLPLCMILAKGIMRGICRYSSERKLHNAYTSGKGPSDKAKCPSAFLDRQARYPVVDLCTQEYRDWTKDFPAPAGSKNTREEHFVWLSTSHQPYTHDPGSPFVPPDFTLGLPPVRDLPRRSGEPPWPLDPKDHPKPKPDLVAPADSIGASSPDEGKQRRKKKKHHRPKKTELKVTTRGLGTDHPVWTNAGLTESSSLMASSQSEGDSGLGSNLRVTDTKPQTRAPLRTSPDAQRDPTEVMEDAPLSDRGEDIEMVDAEVIEAERPNSEVGLFRGARRIWKRYRSRLLVNRKRIRTRLLGKGIPRHPKILRMTLLSLTGRCFKASGQ